MENINEKLSLFGRLVRRARISQGKSPKAMAKEIGVGDETIYNWEMSDSFPSEDMLIRIAESCKLPLEDLISSWKMGKEVRKQISEARKPPKAKRVVSPDCEVYMPSRSGPGKTRAGFAFRN